MSWLHALLGACLALTPLGAPAALAATIPDEWPLDSHHFRADQVWQTSQGDGITVAVVDSGVQGTHPDLSGQLKVGAGFVGVASDDGRTDISPDSHGTSMAGIIAGAGSAANSGMAGLAPHASVLPIRVSLGTDLEPVTVAKGIFYAADHGANIINISLDTGVPDPNLKAAINYALGKNIIVVASAGNFGRQGNAPMYPASFPGVVDVTGVDESNHFWTSSESGPQSTLAAPAVDIFSTDDHGKYLRGDGTSYAAPYVAAAAALTWSRFRSLTAQQVVRQLVDTADRPTNATHDDQYGFGIVDPLRAVTTPPTGESGLPTATEEVQGVNWLLVGSGIAVVVLAGTGVFFLLRHRRRRAT